MMERIYQDLITAAPQVHWRRPFNVSTRFTCLEIDPHGT
jgi:hypothetical protein